MRIIIETERPEEVSVTRDASTQPLDSPEATDGGGPPEELLQLLSGESAPEEQEADREEPGTPDDGGAAPAWLIDVIEGALGSAASRSTDD